MNLVYTFIFWYGLYNDVMAEINAIGLLVVLSEIKMATVKTKAEKTVER